jgi:hypothetical protein
MSTDSLVQYNKEEDIIMNSDSGKSNPSGGRGTDTRIINDCDHMISTSLRDLSFKYKELGREQADSIDLIKKNIDNIVTEETPD